MAIPRYPSAEKWPLFSMGFRPFFLAAGLWACLAMTLWIFMLRGVFEMPTIFNPVAWHFHEFLFGFVAAAIAGFLLTAIPNWTGRLPLQGWPLGAIVLLWTMGRIAVAFSAWIGPTLAMVIDLSFLAVFMAIVAREIFAGRNWRNLPVLAALGLLVIANLLIHLGAVIEIGWEEIGKRTAISVVVLLISLIGGRIIPSFTTNWLKRHQSPDLPAPFDRFDAATLAFSAIALVVWIGLGTLAISGAALIGAAALHSVRLMRWRGALTLREPILWILHLGYAWIPTGLALLGSSVWIPSLTTAAIHALTVGAMGTMILAVMTRASLGHSKRQLTAGTGTIVAYVLVLVAAGARLIAPLLETGYAAALDLAGGAWIAAFALFTVLYAPLYLRR